MEAIGLDAREEKFLVALLESPTITAATKQAGIAKRTGLDYLRREHFRKAFRDARREMLTATTARLQQASGRMVEVLTALAEDTKSPAGVRVSAARSLLELAYRASELEVCERLEVLEGLVQQELDCREQSASTAPRMGRRK